MNRALGSEGTVRRHILGSSLSSARCMSRRLRKAHVLGTLFSQLAVKTLEESPCHKSAELGFRAPAFSTSVLGLWLRPPAPSPPPTLDLSYPFPSKLNMCSVELAGELVKISVLGCTPEPTDSESLEDGTQSLAFSSHTPRES